VNIYYAAGFNGSGRWLNHWISLHCAAYKQPQPALNMSANSLPMTVHVKNVHHYYPLVKVGWPATEKQARKIWTWPKWITHQQWGLNMMLWQAVNRNAILKSQQCWPPHRTDMHCWQTEEIKNTNNTILCWRKNKEYKEELSSCWDGRPFGHNRHGPKQHSLKSEGVTVPFSVGGTGSPSNTMSHEPRLTAIPSGILIHPTVWPQYTNVTDRTMVL